VTIFHPSVCLLDCSSAPQFVSLSAHPPIHQYNQGILKGKYHCTIDLLFDWFGICCITTHNFCFYLQNRLIQTSQTGVQRYSDTSPFSIPWYNCQSFHLSICPSVFSVCQMNASTSKFFGFYDEIYS